jgi:AraC family transcriptional regulator of adaptative response / DNA-3-methyladenine glycosylase II
MRWNPEAIYQLFLQRNPANNGKFIVGVLTTGIYCLPACPARRPRRENIRFFRTPEEARAMGLRACLRCHPEYFYRGAEWHESLFEQTTERMRRDPAAFSGIRDIAKAAGLARTALNELFREHAHESPAAFLRRLRIEHAMQQLAGGVRPAAAAAAAGFESPSVFHLHFRARTGLTPAAYAALSNSNLSTSNQFELRLPPRYRLQEALRFFGRDGASVSERVDANSITKCVLIDGTPALIEMQFHRGVARCSTDATDIFAAHHMAVRMAGLDSAADAFEREFAGDKLIGPVIRNQRGLRIPMTPEPWEALAWAICGQQISVKAAVALRRELILRAGTKHPSGLRAHPTAAQVARLTEAQLRGMKFSRSKAEYILAAARAVASGEAPINEMRWFSAVRAARSLKALHGIGDWSVQYTFLRGLGFMDCLPAGDVGLARGLQELVGNRPDPVRIREMMDRYSPWRSYATYHVWSSLKGAGE